MDTDTEKTWGQTCFINKKPAKHFDNMFPGPEQYNKRESYKRFTETSIL
jgi:hypothetical protein